MSQNTSFNSTIANASSLEQSNQVSPQSALFGILALGLYAMTQPSVLGQQFSESNALRPYRSSPFLCILDTLILITSGACHIKERLLLYLHGRQADRQNEALEDAETDAFYNTSSDMSLLLPPKTDESATSSASSPTVLTMRVFIFVLGVAPQAIKLRAMQGIPFTQACAALFLVSSLVSGGAGIVGIEFFGSASKKAS